MPGSPIRTTRRCLGSLPRSPNRASHLDYGIPWQELTRTVGAVVGQAERAGELVRAVEARFDEVRAEHPELVGATAVVATPFDGPFAPTSAAAACLPRSASRSLPR
ncbi:MAG: hypothetical protein ACRD0K_19110 [Egibacteraceae bacterium]